MEEIFKPIIDHPGYEISNLGNIFSLKTFRLMNPSTQSRGYKYIQFLKNGKQKPFLVHRIVAIHFIDNPNNYPFVNHIDSDRKNNRVDNLEWCTHKMNVAHAISKDRFARGEAIGTGKLSNDEVFRIRELSDIGMMGSKIAYLYKLNRHTVYDIINRKCWTHI